MDFDEAGFTDYGAHNLVGSAWHSEVDALEYLASHGKAFDVNGIVAARKPSRRHPRAAELGARLLAARQGNRQLYRCVSGGRCRPLRKSLCLWQLLRPTSIPHPDRAPDVPQISEGRAPAPRLLRRPGDRQPLRLAHPLAGLSVVYYNMFGQPHASARLAPACDRAARPRLGRPRRGAAVAHSSPNRARALAGRPCCRRCFETGPARENPSFRGSRNRQAPS